MLNRVERTSGKDSNKTTENIYHYLRMHPEQHNYAQRYLGRALTSDEMLSLGIDPETKFISAKAISKSNKIL